MTDLTHEFLKAKEFVLVGASANPEKYGNVILKNMTGRGYNVIPVNPNEATIEGIPCVSSLAAMNVDAPYINFVLPARVTLGLIPDLVSRNCRIAWLQPGAESPDLIAALEKNGIQVIGDGSCIMVVAGQM